MTRVTFATVISQRFGRVRSVRCVNVDRKPNIKKYDAAVAQLGEHALGKREVAGSIPAGSLQEEQMVTDNFQQIADILRLREDIITDDTFFFLQIVKRKKDNPELESHRHLIDSWYIKDADHLVKYKDRIIEQCEKNNARAYFRLNKRSYEKVALQTLALVAQNIAAGNYDIKNCYEKCAGLYHSDEDKTWVVDIDYDKNSVVQTNQMMRIRRDIAALVNETGRDSTTYLVPTKNGIHIITRPFNVQRFKEMWPDVDIHKDNPTILYVP